MSLLGGERYPNTSHSLTEEVYSRAPVLGRALLHAGRETRGCVVSTAPCRGVKLSFMRL